MKYGASSAGTIEPPVVEQAASGALESNTNNDMSLAREFITRILQKSCALRTIAKNNVCEALNSLFAP